MQIFVDFDKWLNIRLVRRGTRGSRPGLGSIKLFHEKIFILVAEKTRSISFLRHVV
jgi:hypothetical protein